VQTVLAPTVRNSRLAHLRSRYSFAHWPAASLFRPLGALGSGPALIRRALCAA